MPLTSKGTQILSKMQSRYGAKKGTSVFYATANKRPSFKRVVRGAAARKV